MTYLAALLLLLVTTPVAAQFDAVFPRAVPPGGSLPPPLLEPAAPGALGPGINTDAAGQPFRYRTRDGQPLTIEPPPDPDGYGLGVGRDIYGRPVEAEPGL